MNFGKTENLEALKAAVAEQLAGIRKAVAGEHGDPRVLFDEVQMLISRLEAAQQHVPDELREFVAELEAEIVEDFYDNLPV